MIPPEKEAEVLRLHHAEHWKIGTIAAQLGLHHTTVRRVLAQQGVEPRATPGREVDWGYFGGGPGEGEALLAL